MGRIKIMFLFKLCIILYFYLMNRNMNVKKVKIFKFEKKIVVECFNDVGLLRSFFIRLMNKYNIKGKWINLV